MRGRPVGPRLPACRIGRVRGRRSSAARPAPPSPMLSEWRPGPHSRLYATIPPGSAPHALLPRRNDRRNSRRASVTAIRCVCFSASARCRESVLPNSIPRSHRRHRFHSSPGVRRDCRRNRDPSRDDRSAKARTC